MEINLFNKLKLSVESETGGNREGFQSYSRQLDYKSEAMNKDTKDKANVIWLEDNPCTK